MAVRPRPPKYIIPPEIDQDELIREFTAGPLGAARHNTRKKREADRKDGENDETAAPAAPLSPTQYAGTAEGPDGGRMVRLSAKAKGRDVLARRAMAVIAAILVLCVPVRRFV